MRDFRYLRVTESSTDWLASCNLLADGVYMKYMKITKEIREKTQFRREKLHVFHCSFFFIRLKPTARNYSENHSAYNSYESFLKKKVLIFKAISGTDNAYCGSKLKFPFLLVLFTSWYDVSNTMRFWYGWKFHSLDSDLFDN